MKHSVEVLTAVLLIFAPAVISGSAQAVSVQDSILAAAGVESDVATNPLKPADTSSPRATLRSFVDNMNRSYRLLMAAHRDNTEAPGLFDSESAKRMAKEAEGLFQRAVGCLDLSEIPTALKRDIGWEKALQLKEILDRVELPPADLIPGAIEGETEEGVAPLPRWRVPDTDIVIARVEDGPREGEYLFTPRTVARLDDFYHRVMGLPYKSDEFTTDGFLDFYISTPGWLMPPKWNQWLPEWSKRVYLSRTIWQWCGLVILILLWVLVVMATFRALLMGAATLSPAAQSWRRTLFCLISIVTLLGVHVMLRDQVNITGPLFIYLRLILHPIWWLLAGAMTLFAATALAEMIIASPRIDPAGIQASYFRALFGVCGFIGGAVVFLFGLSRIGVSLIPLLTGVGIGGLAVALATRPTLEGIISSFTIFADNPYRLGERVNVLGHMGTVEAIGLRSTRIRLLNGHVTVIPNQKMATSEIENIGRRPYIRRTFNVTITYGTPPEKINRAVDILKEILAVPGTPELQNDDAASKLGDGPAVESERYYRYHPNEAINRLEFTPRVYFNELNADSLNIYVSYWFHPPEFWDYMEHAHWINVQIMERFKAEGIEFAFPTQTLHLAGDKRHPLITRQQPISDEDAP